MKDESAFPQFNYDVVRTSVDKNGNNLIQPIYVAEGGLTKREWGAFMVLQGVVANERLSQAIFEKCMSTHDLTAPDGYAQYTLECVDALIMELSKNK